MKRIVLTANPSQNMPLTEAQRNRALWMGREGWGEDDDLDKYLAEVTDCEELHVMAETLTDRHPLPCAVAAEALLRVIAHPLCDKGTALMIYWRCGPHHWDEYTFEIHGPGHNESATADLMRAILEKVRVGAYQTHSIDCDPHADDECYGMPPRHAALPAEKSGEA